MTIRVVFFDLGGTLLVMRRDKIFRRVLQEEGYVTSPEAVHLAYHAADPWWLSVYGDRKMTIAETSESYRALEQKVFLDLFPREDRSEAVRVSIRVRKRWPELANEIPHELYPDAEPTLRRLRDEGHFLGLVSNAPADTKKTVEILGISKYLDSVVISGVVGYSKPNPEIFRIALKEAEADPAQAVHVGDLYEADVVGANNAGIKGILIDREGSQVGLDCPRISSLSEIYRHL